MQVTALLNSTGGDASEYLEEALPDMIYNDSTDKYEATLHSTTMNDAYVVTATDEGGLRGYGDGNFTVGPTCAIEIDFNAFGDVGPGGNSSVEMM